MSLFKAATAGAKAHTRPAVEAATTGAVAAASRRAFSAASKVKEKNSRRFWPAEVFSAAPPLSPTTADRGAGNSHGAGSGGSSSRSRKSSRRGKADGILGAPRVRKNDPGVVAPTRDRPSRPAAARTLLVRRVGRGHSARHSRRLDLRPSELTVAHNRNTSPRAWMIAEAERATASPGRSKTASQMAALLRALEATNRTAIASAATTSTATAPASASAAAAAASSVRMFDKTLRGYERGGKWKPAIGLLNRLTSDASSAGGLRRPDSETYGIVVSTCAKAGRWREATDLVLREMPAWGVTADTETYGAVLGACGQRGRWREALAVMAGMVRAGLTPTVAMYNNAITLCGGGGRAQVAVDLLEQMAEEAPGVAAPNVASVNSVMTACQQAGEWRRTLGLLRRLQASEWPGVKANVRSFNIAIKAVGDSGDCDAALALFREMLTAGIAANVDSYSSVAAAFEKAGRVDDINVLGILENMSSSLAKSSSTAAADSVTIGGTVLSANPQSGTDGHRASKKWRQAVGLLREVEGSAARRSAGTAAGVGQPAEVAPAGGAQEQQALALLKDMSGTEMPETVGSFSLAITKHGHGGRWEEAVGLLRAMGAAGVPPSRKCYHGAITACGNSGRHEEALELLREMPGAGFPLSDKSYRCAISACGNAGRPVECISLLREARAAGLPPSPGSYSLAIMACGDAGRLEEALSLLEEAEALDIVSNGACYNAAVKACKDCGRPEEAAAVLERSRKSTITTTAVSC